MVLKAINKDKYFLSTVIISLMVAVLIHFPESVSLFDRFESHSLFPGMKFMDVANEILFTFVSLLILFAINTRLFHFNQASIKITAAKILLSFILTWILSNLLGQVFVFLHRTFDIPAIDAMVHHYLHPLRDFIMACLVTSSCCIIYLVRRQQLVLIENEQLQAENIRNQYEVLKNQLNPHMLFNSLNTLRSLVRENQDKAQDYIQELSRVLRYTLQSNESQSVSLREELDYLKKYVEVQHYRFGDSFIIYYEVDDDVMDAEVFRLMLQPVVENSLLHALRGNERGYMKVRARRIGDKVNLRVIDNGDGMTREELEALRKRIADRNSRSIGLTNLDRRLRLRYPEETGLRICSIKNLGTSVSFCIPYKKYTPDAPQTGKTE